MIHLLCGSSSRSSSNCRTASRFPPTRWSFMSTARALGSSSSVGRPTPIGTNSCRGWYGSPSSRPTLRLSSVRRPGLRRPHPRVVARRNSSSKPLGRLKHRRGCPKLCRFRHRPGRLTRLAHHRRSLLHSLLGVLNRACQLNLPRCPRSQHPRRSTSGPTVGVRPGWIFGSNFDFGPVGRSTRPSPPPCRCLAPP